MKLKHIAILTLGLLGACSQEGANFTGSFVRPDQHPLTAYLAKEEAAGGKDLVVSVNSDGGSSSAWLGLAQKASTPGLVGRVDVKSRCISACALFVTTVAAKGVLVRIEGDAQVVFHGMGISRGKDQYGNTIINRPTESQIGFNVLLWTMAGLPTWAAELEKALGPNDFHTLNPAEITAAGFRRD